jgi:hypothetical protein
MDKKVKFVMVGQCSVCGEEFIRKPPVNVAVCLCATKAAEKKGLNPLPEPIIISLSPALLLPVSIYKRYAKIAELAEISVERLINAMLKEGAKRKLQELNEKLKPLPSVVEK